MDLLTLSLHICATPISLFFIVQLAEAHSGGRFAQGDVF